MHAKPPLSTLPLPDYATAEQNAWQVNAAAAQASNTAVSSRRIATYEWKFGYPRAVIEAEITNNPMFAAAFSKNPVNSGFEKEVVYDWLDSNLPVQIIEKLSPNRDDAFFVTATGEIRKLRANEEKPSKALNFRWVMGGITYYALHKYTPNNGGQQGKQFNADKAILRNFNQATDPNVVLIVIVDGDYYTNTNPISKIEQLRNLANSNTPKSFAVHTQDVPWAISQCP